MSTIFNGFSESRPDGRGTPGYEFKITLRDTPPAPIVGGSAYDAASRLGWPKELSEAQINYTLQRYGANKAPSVAPAPAAYTWRYDAATHKVVPIDHIAETQDQNTPEVASGNIQMMLGSAASWLVRAWEVLTSRWI